MKNHHLDAVIVAALLMTYVPSLAEQFLPESTPAALILPASSDIADENTPDEFA